MENNLITINELLRSAFKIGYRHLDCAFLYKNEELIGNQLHEILNESNYRRTDLFITSKLPMNGMKPDHIEYYVNKSLNNLNISYFDLYLIHAPFAVKVSLIFL